MSADFLSFAAPMEPTAGRRLAAELLASEEEYRDNVYINGDVESLMQAGDDVGVAMSPNYAVFVAIDRFAMERALLGGHAVRFVAPEEIPAVRAAIEASSQALGGMSGVQDKVAPHLDRWGNGRDDVAEGIDALTAGLDVAEADGVGLLLVCMPA